MFSIPGYLLPLLFVLVPSITQCYGTYSTLPLTTWLFSLSLCSMNIRSSTEVCWINGLWTQSNKGPGDINHQIISLWTVICFSIRVGSLKYWAAKQTFQNGLHRQTISENRNFHPLNHENPRSAGKDFVIVNTLRLVRKRPDEARSALLTTYK